MNRINNWIGFIIAFFVIMSLFFGCKSISNTTEHSISNTTEHSISNTTEHSISNTTEYEDNTMTEYYKIEDFSSIIIGKSTHREVYEVAPHASMQVTSYGGVCVYPTQEGGCIRIKFYGKNLVVGAIEEVVIPENDSGCTNG